MDNINLVSPSVPERKINREEAIFKIPQLNEEARILERQRKEIFIPRRTLDFQMNNSLGISTIEREARQKKHEKFSLGVRASQKKKMVRYLKEEFNII